MTGPREDWDPAQYARFREERAQPFYDLAGLVRRRPNMSVLDLGCGQGALTAWLHRTLEAAETLGVDSSPSMLADARTYEVPGLRFADADIASMDPGRTFDLVYSNAALQWVAGHDALFARIATWIAPGGQLAMQLPANTDHPAQAIGFALAREEPYASALHGYTREDTVLPPEQYSALLYRLGFPEQHVSMRVYPHLLPAAEAVVEWMRGTFLAGYRMQLPPDLYAPFVTEYERRLLATIGTARPYLFTFKRILIWAQAA